MEFGLGLEGSGQLEGSKVIKIKWSTEKKSDLKKLCQDNEGLQCPLMNLVSPVGNGALDIQIEISDLHRSKDPF